jgi:hypothetical protein
MKNFNALFVLFMILLINFSSIRSQGSCCGDCGGCCGNNDSGKEDPNGLALNNLQYFVGNWVGLDYTCNGGPIKEQVNFPSNLNKELYAKKVTADSCVTVGQVTFRFNKYPSELKYNVGYPVTWTVGSPGSPNSGRSGGTLKIQNKDNFTIDGKRFVRGRLEKGKVVNEFAVVPPAKPCKRTFVKEIIRQKIDENGKITSQTRERVIETDAEKITNVWESTDTILITYDNSFKPNALPNGGNNTGSGASSNTAVSEM